MYEPTELALLMKKMVKDYGESQALLEEGKMPKYKVDYAKDILTSEATDPNDINDLYKSLAAPFIAQADAYAASSDSLPAQIEMHNLTIKSCISCHQSFCSGPISAIKKLLVR